MANLWRVLAIAWLGGVASPALMEDPADIDMSSPASIASEPTSAGSGEQIGDEIVRLAASRASARTE